MVKFVSLRALVLSWVAKVLEECLAHPWSDGFFRKLGEGNGIMGEVGKGVGGATNERKEQNVQIIVDKI